MKDKKNTNCQHDYRPIAFFRADISPNNIPILILECNKCCKLEAIYGENIDQKQ